MPENEVMQNQPAMIPGWGLMLVEALCPHCDWRYLVPPESLPLRCPHCIQADLEAVEGGFAQSYTPELSVPFSVSEAEVARQIETFAAGIPYAPEDLNPQALRSRVRRVALPLWLVDSQVQATWDAEMGFNYQVVSHQERYTHSEWQTQEVQETRARWEPRVGRLARVYQNITAPALERYAALLQAVGAYRLEDARPYAAEALRGAVLRLPDRAPEAAWSDALPNLQAAAGEDCRQAARADHIRQYRWAPNFTAAHWTLLLLPLYATFYFDDEQQPQPVFINGQSGHISGARRASQRRAQQRALLFAALAVGAFVLGLLIGGLGLLLAPLLLLAPVLMLLGLVLGVLAVIAIFRAWNFNRKPQGTEAP